ncbi:uncharacterized protein EV420DRAFT_1280790, partial [Desarmillaria tabescens]
PQLFRAGDIVKVQVTLAVIRGKKRKHHIKPILRAVALIDSDFTQVSDKLFNSQPS